MSPSNLRSACPFFLTLLLGMSGLAIAGCNAPQEEAIAAGNSAFAAGDFASATSWYQAAIQEDADSAAAWINTGLARLRAEQFEEAIEAFRRGATKARGPLAARAFFDLGAASLLGGDVDTAIEAFREALRLDPTDEDARHDLELAMAMRNQQQESQESESQEQEQGEDGQEGDEEQEGQEGDSQEQESEDGQEGQESQEGQPEEDPSGGSQQEGETGEEEEGAGGEEGEESEQGEGAQADSGDEASEEESELSEEQAAALQEALEGMTPAQARQLLRALGGDSRSLQQVLQMRLPANGQRPDKDW